MNTQQQAGFAASSSDIFAVYSKGLAHTGMDRTDQYDCRKMIGII